MSNQLNNKRIAKNTAFLYVRMFFALIVSLYTSRVVLNELGVVDFGINSVVAGFVSMFSFLTATLSSSMQRFYNYEGQINGKEGFQKVYIAGVLIHIAMAILIFILLETFGIWYVNNILVIPADRLFAASILYQTSVVSIFLVILQTPYTGAILAQERMSFYAMVGILDVIFRLIFVIMLPYFSCDKLIMFAFFSLSVTVINTSLYVGYVRKNFSELKLTKVFDAHVLKSIMSFSTWNMIGTFAYMSKGQGINMLLNFFYGPVINAARSIAYQINTAISGFYYNISMAFRPQLVNAYADGKFERTRRLMFSESKICFVLIALLITPLIIEMNYILYLWLGGIVPEFTSIFAILVLIDMLVNTLNTPCAQIVHAVGNIKQFQIATTIVNLGLLPVCWGLLQLGYDANFVFVATIVFSCVNQIVCLIYANKLFSFGLSLYIKEVIFPCMSLVCLLPILPYCVTLLIASSFIRMLIVCGLTLIVAAPICYFLVFDNREQAIFKNIIISKLKF